jgi:hypothetical protein
MAMIPRNQGKRALDTMDLRKSLEFVKYVKTAVRDEFRKIKREIIQEFDEHLVTREIEAGPNAENISRTLGGRGNLFSFIGFNKGDKPTLPIRQAFEDMTLTSTIVRRNGSSESQILYPSKDDIFKVTPMPWAEGRSWAAGIEEGISNLGQFLQKSTPDSRSGAGIQSKNQVSQAQFSKTPYVSEILKSLERKIQELNSSII